MTCTKKPLMENGCGEREKLLVTSIFSFALKFYYSIKDILNLGMSVCLLFSQYTSCDKTNHGQYKLASRRGQHHYFQIVYTL